MDGHIAFGETHIFVGKGYVVSVRRGACETCPVQLGQGEDYVFYAILDFIVDNYMPVIESYKMTLMN